MSCKRCFFKSEFNNSTLQNLGCTVAKVADGGKDVSLSFQYKLLDIVDIDNLLNMVRQSNPQLKIHYTKDTIDDVSQVKETEKPVWDFRVESDGKHITLKRV